MTPRQPLKVAIALSPTHFVASLIVSFVDKVPDNAHDKEWNTTSLSLTHSKGTCSANGMPSLVAWREKQAGTSDR